jgi:hypothetical protein
MFSAIKDDVTKAWRQPFSADMSAPEWFLFVGLLLVIMILWRIILRHILEG